VSQDLATFVPFVLIVLVFWFLVIRPQRRRQQEMNAIQSSVAVGSQVMLGSGIFGTVVGVEDDTVLLEISPGTTIKVARQAVVRVVEPAPGLGDPPPAEPGPDAAPGDKQD
jgi:preprotein translocase subunit YajC